MDGDGNGRGWELVAGGGGSGDDFSIFPPSLHEGLTPALTLDSPDYQFQDSVEGLEEGKQQDEGADDEAAIHASGTPFSQSAKRARRLVGSGIELVRSKIALLREGGCSVASMWSFAALAGAAGVLLYLRRRQRRERELLLFLILEKDERINQLMDQIVKMSEVIATNYKVPVAKN